MVLHDAPAPGDALDRRVARRIPALLYALSLAFAFFAGLTLVVRPPGATIPLAAIDLAGALVLGGAAIRFQRGGVPAGAANVAGGAALFITLAASLVAIKLLHLPAQTTNILLVQLLASLVLLSMRWVGSLIGASIVAWSAIAWSEGLTEAWLNAGSSLVATSIMGVMIQLVRLRDARRYDALAALEHTRARDLERTVASERDHVRALASANQSLESFAFIISHDLKEPIRATDFFLSEARSSTSEEERIELIERAAQSHRHLTRLVEGLLAWSRATTAPVDPVEVDVEELLADATTRALFERVLEEHRAKLLVQSGFPPVLGTPALVRQVLGNLILNAAKHNNGPQPQVRVYAASDAPAGMVDVVVEDNGPGFPEPLLAAMGGSEPARPSTGFGLLIARRAAQRMGGALHLTNRPEGGATVHVTLPAPAAPIAPAARPADLRN